MFLVVLALQITSCREQSGTSPLIRQVRLCNELVDGACTDEKPSFSATTNTFYVSCILEKANEEAEVSFLWFFYENGKKQLLEKVVLKPWELSDKKTSDYVLVANLNRSGGRWPEGKYEVEVVLGGLYPFSVIKSFNI